MKNLFTALVGALALPLILASSVAAQTAAPAAYTGPRFPGGPDSLRALVYRSTRLAAPAPTGRMLVQFELDAVGKPFNFTMVRPAEPLNKPLVNATAAALDHLEAHMPAWQPGAPDPKAGTSPKVSLVFDFSTPLAAQPFAYPSQEPIFPDFGALLHAQHNIFYDRQLQNRNLQDQLNSPEGGLSTFVQMQVRYPPAAMRQREQGTVYAYFEVAENGAIEHPEVVGSAGSVLDTEVLEVVKHLPVATVPAQVQGRAVRVFYVLPVSFKLR